jgi:energy-coupling factor transporter transmembrane protein EcfT
MDAKARPEFDHYSYLINRQHRFLLIGIVLLLVAVVFTLTGETFERYGGIVRGAEEPKRFWWDVALFYLGGILFIALYFFSISN